MLVNAILGQLSILIQEIRYKLDYSIVVVARITL